MTTFLIVRFEDESRANEVIPSSWYADGKCAMPAKNVQKAAKENTICKMSWKHHVCTVISSHDSYEKASYKKDEYAVSGSAGVFLSSCGRSLRSEGSKRIQQQKNATLRRNNTAAGPIIQPLLATTSKSHRPITPSSDEDSDSVLENSEVSATIKAGPITRPLHRQTVGQLNLIPPLIPVYGENFSLTRGSSNLQATNNEDSDCLMVPSTSQIEAVQQSWIGQRHEQRNPGQRSPFQKFVVKMLRNQNKYLRTMAREVADIKSENRELRKLLQSRQPVNNNIGDSWHSLLEKHVSLPLKTVDDFKHFEEELLKVEVRSNLIEMLRSFFETNVEDTIRRLWKEVMSNELMRLYTWSGTPKPNSGKQKGLAVKGSRLMSAIIETVKYGEFEKTTIPKIEQTSKLYIRKAVDRLKSSKE